MSKRKILFIVIAIIILSIIVLCFTNFGEEFAKGFLAGFNKTHLEGK